MQVKELYAYIDAKREADMFRQALADHRSRMTAAGGQDFSGVGGNRFPTDRQADALAITVKLEDLIKSAEARMQSALEVLIYAQTVLGGREIIYFHKRFFEGKTRAEIMSEMHYGHTAVDRIARAIKDKIRHL